MRGTQRHSEALARITDAVPTRCRRGSNEALTGSPWGHRGATVGLPLGYRGDTRECRGGARSSTGLSAVSACACNARVRVRVCSFVCLGSFGCVRAASVRVCVPLTACVCAFPSDCIFARVCTRSLAVRTPIARAGACGINSSARAARRRPRARLRSVPPAGLARVGRRSDVHQSYEQRAVGCASLPRVGGRRRRRHLRHRRLLRQLHTPGRVGEHRQRCAAGLSRWGVVEGVLEGVLRGY